MPNSVIKRFGGFPCCHRQHKALSHCRFLHGYDRHVEITWDGPRDDQGWVLDFGALKPIRQALEHQFDHTTLISLDDPHRDDFLAMSEAGVIDLRVMDPTMEGMTLWVRDLVQDLQPTIAEHAQVVRIECWENEKNAAVWTP
jgi:6-pyruvoyltetrahydropterin/6-carboxytetrahydropterin synthase